MPLVTVLGTSDSLPGNIAFGDGAEPTRYPSWFQTPTLEVHADGLVLSNPISATILGGHDLGASTATVEFLVDPDISKYSVIEIWAGAGINHELRFTGLYLTTQAELWPHTVSLICKGMLWRAEIYRQAAFIGLPTFVVQQILSQGIPLGMPLAALLNGAQATDDNIVLAILNQVPDLFPDSANFSGTGATFGTVSYRDMIWPPYRSALQQIHLFDEVCLGFKTYDTRFGRVARTQLFGYPTGIADTIFTEGIDIWRGTGVHGVESLINGVFVEGATLPNGEAGLIFAFQVQDNPFFSGTQPVVEQFGSAFIETSDLADPSHVSASLNADRVAEWRLTEGNRELVNVDFTTFRDEILVPGRTIAVNAPHMTVTQPVWMQRVELRVQVKPILFQQRISGLGGGDPGFGDSPGYFPPNLNM